MVWNFDSISDCYLLGYVFIDLIIRVFASGPGNKGSFSGRIIPKIQKMGLDISLLKTHHKVRFEGKVELSREKSSILP